MENGKKPPRVLLEDPEQIVYQGLQTLGLSKRWLAELMNIQESDLPLRLNIKHLKGREWFKISNALYLPGDFISFGYVRMSHKASVRWACRDGYCHLPRTWGFWKLRFEIFKDVLEDLRFQGKHYGFRLRWKARYQDFSKWLKQKIKREHRAYNPIKDAREFFQPEPPESGSLRPGLEFRINSGKAPESELTLS